MVSAGQPAASVAQKKPAATSTVLQARTTRQKTAAVSARPAAAARPAPAVTAPKPQPAKGAFISLNYDNICSVSVKLLNIVPSVVLTVALPLSASAVPGLSELSPKLISRLNVIVRVTK